MAIQSFAESNTERFFVSGVIGKGVGWSKVVSVVKRKLDMVDYASVLSDLRSPPGNQLEALVGDLAGYHSIRINDQWRIVVKWTPSGPKDVRVTDYH